MTWTVPTPSPVDGPTTGDDRPILEGYLNYQRSTLLNICAGLTGEQLARRPIPSSNLSLLALIRHLAKVERIWFRQRAAGQPVPPLYDPARGKDADFNDAVAADNFTVFHGKISKPFREQFPSEKLRAIFKDLIEKHAVFDAVVASPIVSDEEAKIDEQGVLRLKGHFDTSPKKVKYQLGFIPSDGLWKLSGVTIDIE